MTLKKCSKCGEEKELNEFKKSSIHKFGVYPSCRECGKKNWKENYHKIAEKHRARTKKYAENNQEQVKASRKNYYQKNAELMKLKTREWSKNNQDRVKSNKKSWKAGLRAKKQNVLSTLTAFEIERQRYIQHGCCFYCGDYLGMNYSIDHFIPMSVGGQNVIENIVIACMSCNQDKGRALPNHFMKIM